MCCIRASRSYLRYTAVQPLHLLQQQQQQQHPSVSIIDHKWTQCAYDYERSYIAPATSVFSGSVQKAKDPAGEMHRAFDSIDTRIDSVALSYSPPPDHSWIIDVLIFSCARAEIAIIKFHGNLGDPQDIGYAKLEPRFTEIISRCFPVLASAFGIAFTTAVIAPEIVIWQPPVKPK